MEDIVKRDIFSLFLRCGAAFYKGDFSKALLSYHLTEKCLPAIKLFLSGYTRFVNNLGIDGGEHGFVDAVCDYDTITLKTDYFLKN